MTEQGPAQTLVLHIAVPDLYADDLTEIAAIWSDGEPTAEDMLYVVVNEWMRRTVGLTIVTIPGEKCTNDDFEVHAYTAEIVGASLQERGGAS